MYERNFGPWDSMKDSVKRCLEKVDESEIFLLLIKDRAGTFYPDADRTVTHMEFMQAYNHNKTVLVFIESRVKALYFTSAKALIEEYIDHYKKENRKYPMAADIVSALSSSSKLPSHIDPYVWFFIHDLVDKGIYCEELALGVTINWKDYFSDLLRRGVMLLPLENFFEVTEKSLTQHEEFYEFITESIPYLHAAQEELPSFLKLLMERLPGGIVKHHYGDYLSEEIGTFGPCSAIVLFKRHDDRMKFVAKAGKAMGKPVYALDNPNSYIALTYTLPLPEQVFFKEAEPTFYLCLKTGEYVLTFHFPGDSGWNNDRFMAFRDSVLHAIINKNPVLFEFVRKLIGGIRL